MTCITTAATPTAWTNAKPPISRRRPGAAGNPTSTYPPRAKAGRGNPKPHADYIDENDFPRYWLGRSMTVDVEAKAKELAVVRIMQAMNGRQ